MQRASVAKATERAAGDQDMVKLVLQLRPRVLPCAVVLLAEERSERGQCLRLEEHAQPTARRVHVRQAVRSNSSCAPIIVAAQAAATNARVAVGADHDVGKPAVQAR